MNSIVYSHNLGENAIPEQELVGIKMMIKELNFTVKSNSATRLRNIVLESLMKLGWSDKIRIDEKSNVTITAMKNSVGLCLQTGNMGRFYADILKLEALFQKDKAIAAVYIIPTKEAASKLGNNIAYFERLVEELKIYKHIITIPMAIVGIE